MRALWHLFQSDLTQRWLFDTARQMSLSFDTIAFWGLPASSERTASEHMALVAGGVERFSHPRAHGKQLVRPVSL
jgi:hypothetical protein